MENQEKFEAIADFDGNLMKTQSENDEENTEISYLTFKKGEKLVLVAAYENGWNYGFLEPKPGEYGFFPSNYVKKIIDTSDDTKETKVEIDKPASPQKENPLKRKSENNWMDFVQGILSNEPEKNDTQDPTAKKEISENDILNEALVQNNYNSIIGYKKIKITNDPSQPLKKRPQFNIGNNPAPVLNNEFAMVCLFLYSNLF